ncbi:MAG: GAF domain-containing protein [Anaerolineae bacterium]|nr:GAF domain-containing protein [Anaerolineae bacterium]
MEQSKRTALLNLYRIAVGLVGICALIVLSGNVPWSQASIPLILFALLSLIIKRAGFHIAPGVTHSLVGIVDVAALLLFGPVAGGIVATTSCLIYLLLRTLRHQTLATRNEMLQVALFSAGLKALTALGSGWLYRAAGGRTLSTIVADDVLPLLVLFVAWFVIDHLGWGLSESIQGGLGQVAIFLRAVWGTSLLVEFLPLWTSVIIVFVYVQDNMFVFWLLAIGLIAVSLIVQRLSDMWENAQRRLAEVTALSEMGQAIVSAQLDEDDLCELIYQQASTIVDTSSFHLGLFDDDDYILKISVKDNVHQSGQTFPMAADKGIVGWLRHSKLPLLVQDFQREMDSLPARPRYNSERPPRSGVFVPLIARNEVIGTMSIQSFRPATFSQDHLRLLSVIGNQAAMAIEKVRLYETEQHRARQLALIDNVSRKVASILELDVLFAQVVQLVRETFGYYHVNIFSVAPDSAEPVLEASTNVEFERKNFRLAGGQGIVGWVSQKGQPLLANDVSQDERFLFEQSLPETRAELAVPLKVESRVLGVLDVESDRTDAFSQDDLFILQTLASSIAMAIEDARLYAAQREEAWVTTALLQVAEATSKLSNLSDVLTTVVRLTPMLTGVDRCGIWLWDDKMQRYVPAQAYGLKQDQRTLFATLHLSPEDAPALEQVRLTREPLVLPSDQLSTSLPKALSDDFNVRNLLILPLSARGQALGVMLVDYAEPFEAFTERKTNMIAGIANQAAVAIENAQLYAAQQKEAYISMALLQVAEAVRSLTSLQDILSTIVRITPILVGVEQCVIFLLDSEKQTFLLVQAYGLSEDKPINLSDVDLNPGTPLRDMILEGQFVLGMPDDLESHQAMEEVALIEHDMAILALPLRAKGRVLGTMIVDCIGAPKDFIERWLSILGGIADQTSIAIENTQLYRLEAERQRLARELLVAREIQASFLPEQYPSLPGWELDAFWQSARQVGGDFYDMFVLPDNRVGLVIADVADKGIPAALFMALSRTLVRIVAHSGLEPAQVLERTNDLIISDTHSDLFVTVFYVLLDPESGELVYANGGHNPPILIRQNGEVESLRARGIVLGIVSPIHLEEKRVTVEPGDTLVMYTDGVTDAINEDEEEFGTARLAEIVRRTREQPSQDMLAAIYNAVLAFTGDTPQFDDVTLVVVKRTQASLT